MSHARFGGEDRAKMPAVLTWHPIIQPSQMRRITTIDRFGILLCTSALLEQVPQASWRTGLFVSVASWALFSVLLRGRVFVQRTLADAALIGFVIMVGGSLVWGLMGGVTVNQWVRGAVPFCFLLFLFTIDRNEPDAASRMVRYVCLASALWLFRVLAELLFLIGADRYVYAARLTGQIVDSVIPFGLVALPFILGGVYKTRYGTHFLLGIGLFLITLLAGYRSQSAIVLVQCGVIAARALTRPTQMARLVALVVGMVALVLFFGEQAGRAIVERFQSTNAEFESSRLSEWKYALSQFATKPVLGWGIGWQVPAEVTFEGAMETLLADGVELPSSAGYVHNVTGYLIMDLGLAGLLLYYGFYLSAAARGLMRKPADAAARNLRIMTWLSLVSILVYFQVQAAFRLIQVNLLIVAMLAILGSIRLAGRRPERSAVTPADGVRDGIASA